MLVGLILGVVGFFAQGLIPESALLPGLGTPDTFELFLRSLSAGLTEEIFFRFGLMTFFVYVIRSIVRNPAVEAPSLWLGNFLSAVFFASAHLPQFTFHGWSLVIPFFVFSAGIGMVLGWMFKRYGLLPAIFCHIIADLLVHVVPRWLEAGV